MNASESRVLKIAADAGLIEREFHILTSCKVLLKLRPNGTSDYAKEDLREAARIFWRSAEGDSHGGVTVSTLTKNEDEPAGFRIDRNGTIECFGGYMPDVLTQHALETIARLKP